MAESPILLVEPLPDTALLRRFLEGEGCSIELAQDRDRALELLRSRSYEALIAGAADAASLALLARARRVGPDTPCLIIGAPPELASRAVARGAAGLLAIPLDPADARGVLFQA